MLVDPDIYRRYWRPIFIGTVGLIAIVLVVGRAARGSTRWINVGFFTFQPSEFGKLLFVLAIAGFITERARGARDVRTTLRTVGDGRDPGRARVRPARPRHRARLHGGARGDALHLRDAVEAARRCSGRSAVLAVVVVLWVGPAAGVNFLKPYQKSRLTCFVHPQKCTVDASYNLEQSIAAVGSGQFHGRGLKNATQTRLNFLPEHGTDFVFASYSEQRGFIGASLLLALYLLVLWRGLRIVTVARDLYSAIVAGGIVVALLFQIFVNVGMTMGIAPITGIPLPFVSVGGSSMIANLAAMGVLLAIHARGRGRASVAAALMRTAGRPRRAARARQGRLRPATRAKPLVVGGAASSRRCYGATSVAARSRVRCGRTTSRRAARSTSTCSAAVRPTRTKRR